MEALLDRIMAVMDAAFDPRWGEAWNRRQVHDALSTPNTHVLLAALDEAGTPRAAVAGEPAAGFLLSRAAPGEEELLLLAVVPEQRRHGAAAHLIDRFKRAAAKRGAQKLFLEMRVNNPAQLFYHQQGFKPVGRRRDYYRQSDGTYLDAITFAYDIVAE